MGGVVMELVMLLIVGVLVIIKGVVDGLHGDLSELLVEVAEGLALVAMCGGALWVSARRARRPDYARIAQLERELGMPPSPPGESRQR
jgi:hypothetical protein